MYSISIITVLWFRCSNIISFLTSLDTPHPLWFLWFSCYRWGTHYDLMWFQYWNHRMTVTHFLPSTKTLIFFANNAYAFPYCITVFKLTLMLTFSKMKWFTNLTISCLTQLLEDGIFFKWLCWMCLCHYPEKLCMKLC